MLKYVNTGIVFQEIPDEVTLAINISNCPCHCPGCHSKFLWEDGGDSDPSYLSQLAAYIHTKYPHYRVAWYSGRLRISSQASKNVFDYIKVGPYIAHLGSLKCKTTNQRLYKLDAAGDMQDITYRFWSR